MVADPEQMRFYARPRTRDEAAAWIDRNLRLYDECGYGFWVLESLESSQFVGYSGVRPLELDGACETEIGWHVGKAFWSRGLATEAAAAVCGVAASLGLTRIMAIVHPENVASCRVAAKIGMERETETAFEGEPAVIFRLSG